MLNSHGIVNRTRMTRVSSSYQRMSPNGIDTPNFVGGLAIESLTAAGNTSRPFYPVEARDELGRNRRQVEAIDGQIKREGGKLTDNELTAINGKKEQLVGKIQERYGIAKDAAEKQVDEFTQSYSSSDSAKAKATDPQRSERGMQ